MAKKTTVEIIDTSRRAALQEFENKDFDILEASIKDDICDYKFEVISGIGIGDKHGVKGTGLVKDPLKDALAEFNVHLAIIDDVFKNSGVDEDIEDLKKHEHTFLYNVTGFKIKNEAVVLVGNKYISTGGRINFETPRIAYDDLSSYKWYNELAEAVERARQEVALYKLGYYIPVAEDFEEENPNQLKMSFLAKKEDDLSDFENAAV